MKKLTLFFLLLFYACNYDTEQKKEVNRAINLYDGRSHTFQYTWYRDQQVGGGEESLLYQLIAKKNEDHTVFEQQHPNGFTLKYHIDFEKVSNSYVQGYNEDLKLTFTAKKELTDHTIVYKFKRAPLSNCLKHYEDSSMCEEVLFFTQKYGLISDINRELMAIDQDSSEIKTLLMELKSDKNYFSKK